MSHSPWMPFPALDWSLRACGEEPGACSRSAAAVLPLGSLWARPPCCHSWSLLQVSLVQLSVPSLNLKLMLSVYISTTHSRTSDVWNRSVLHLDVVAVELFSLVPGMTVVNDKFSSWIFAFRIPVNLCFPWYHWCKHLVVSMSVEWFIYLFWEVECLTTICFLKFYNLIAAWGAVLILFYCSRRLTYCCLFSPALLQH